MAKTINILGTEYALHIGGQSINNILKDCNGYTEPYTKKIFIDDLSEAKYSKAENHKECVKQTMRHEIIHAFLVEAGFSKSTQPSWAHNEECTDWFANMMPKIAKAMKQAGCM